MSQEQILGRGAPPQHDGLAPERLEIGRPVDAGLVEHQHVGEIGLLEVVASGGREAVIQQQDWLQSPARQVESIDQRIARDTVRSVAHSATRWTRRQVL